MIPATFEYHVPPSLVEATALLSRLGEDAKVLSGGQSLIPLMKLRLATPRHIVDINSIPGLSDVRESDGMLRIGGLVREADLEESSLIRTRYPLLHDTSGVIADPVVRNLATVGGNLAHGDPANDHPAAMLALDAEVVAVGPRGERRLPVSTFFTGPFATALGNDEILVEVRVPAPGPHSAGAYLKLERKVGDFATAAVAVQVDLDAGGVCTRAGIGLTNVGPVPIKAVAAEAACWFWAWRRLNELADSGARPDFDRIAYVLDPAGRGIEDLVYFTAGTGIGGGALAAGRLVHGLMHSEMGHLLVRRAPEEVPGFAGVCPYHGDCLEGMASGPAIEARWGRPAESLPPNHPAWRIEADYLAQACVNVTSVLSPRVIVLGGGVMEQQQLLEMIRARAAEHARGYFPLPRIERPALEHPGLSGALILAQEAAR